MFEQKLPLLFLIEHEINKGINNLEKDKELFIISREKDIYIFRTYEWDEICYSYGYFQKPNLNLKYPCYKRLTGGGLVLHNNQDLTFSFTGRFSKPIENAKNLYKFLSNSVFHSIEECNPDMKLSIFRKKSFKNRYYNCFEQYADMDIIGNGFKIFGGALRKSQKFFLFQGTIKSEINKMKLRKNLIKHISQLFRKKELLKI